MADNNLEELLGGFAADTLTEEERTVLYTAALQDQELFNALADEQALKELLADPVVRRRLLRALSQRDASGAGSSPSWLDRFRRPAGLAWAGGLAAAAFAVVLGTKVYQDSLRHAAPSVATEETGPSLLPAPAPPAAQPPSPPVAEPQPDAMRTEAPARAPAEKNALPDRVAKREQAPSPRTEEQNASEPATDEGKGRRAQDERQQPADAPGVELGKAAERTVASTDNKPSRGSTPPALAPAPLQALTGAAATDGTAPTISARSLFYGEPAAPPDTGLIAQEKKPAMEPLLESPPQTGRSEERLDRFSQLSRAKAATMTAKPLGLRYSFVIGESDGVEREVDAKTAATSSKPVRLTLETNQEAYLQIWKSVGASPPQLLFPDASSGPHSLKLVAGQRQTVPLSMARGAVSLFVRLSRIPPEPRANQDIPLRDHLSLDRLQESPTALESIAGQEQAAYAVNRDVYSDQLLVNIIKGQ